MQQDQPNGKMTNIELEMAMDQLIEGLPTMIKKTIHDAKYLKAKYDNLITAGFTNEQALEIIKSRPLYE